MTRAHEGVVAEVAANIGGDDLAINSISRNEVLVGAAALRGRRSRRRGATGGSRHVDG